jgi:DNA-binding Lrp family transcriptional regulator
MSLKTELGTAKLDEIDEELLKICRESPGARAIEVVRPLVREGRLSEVGLRSRLKKLDDIGYVRLETNLHNKLSVYPVDRRE